MSRAWVALHCLALLLLAPACAARSRAYVLAAEQDDLPLVHLVQLAEYLNSTVGAGLPGVAFIAEQYATHTAMQTALNASAVDFAFLNQYTQACAELWDYTTLLTSVTSFLPNATSIQATQVAGLAIALAHRTDLNTATDLLYQRLALTFARSTPSFLMYAHKAAVDSIALYAQPGTTNILLYPEDPIDALLHNQTDVALIEAGVLEGYIASHPHLSMADFRVLDEEFNIADDGKPFPYRQSTMLLPNNGLVASMAIAEEIREAVTLAVAQLNTTQLQSTYPQILGFVPPLSTTFNVVLYQGLQAITAHGQSQQCVIFPNDYAIYTCPPGSFLYQPGTGDPRCANYKSQCINGSVVCQCRPCHFSPDQVVYPLPVNTMVPGVNSPMPANYTPREYHSFYAAPCAELATCGTVGQTEEVILEIMDIAYYFNTTRNVTFRIGTDPNQPFSNATVGQFPGQYFARFSQSTVGVFAVTVAFNGAPIESSPFFLQVVPKNCSKSGTTADDNGNCVCKSGYVEFGDGCSPYADLVLVIVLPVLALVIFLRICCIYRYRRLLQKQFFISPKDVSFGEPRVCLGQGRYGSVYKARFKDTEVAVKVLDVNLVNGKLGKTTLMDAGTDGGGSGSSRTHTLTATGSDMSAGAKIRQFWQETMVMAKIRHPCVVSCLGASFDGRTPMLVLELMDSSLYAFLRRKDLEVDADIALPMLRDVVSGMVYLHALNIVHKDLKARNVLVDSNLRAKVADLGFASFTTGAVGTPTHMAPEVLRGTSNTKASDVYAFGMLACEALARQEPFEGSNLAEALQRVAACTDHPPLRPGLPLNVPLKAKALVEACWANDPQQRPTFSEVSKRMEAMDIKNIGLNLFTRRADQLRQARVLHDVFPPHIADMLKKGEKVRPEKRDNVTIFFSDIAGFTVISGLISPEKVSDMLDRMYTKFDRLSDQYDLFKVETIGDAYFAAANLVKDQWNHGELVANFALAAIQGAEETLIDEERPELGYLRIRVGMHTGPVVTNVVGTKNPHFALFGDTVNTASRMESNSLAGYIHLSPSAAGQLRLQSHTLSQHLCSRGQVEIKGKGLMETYFLLRDGQDMPQPGEHEGHGEGSGGQASHGWVMAKEKSILMNGGRTVADSGQGRVGENGERGAKEEKANGVRWMDGAEELEEAEEVDVDDLYQVRVEHSEKSWLSYRDTSYRDTSV